MTSKNDKMGDRIHKFLLTAGCEEDEYEKIRSLIQTENHKTVVALLIVMAAVFTVMAAATAIFAAPAHHILAYSICAVVIALLLFCEISFFSNRYSGTVFVYYAAATVASAFAINSGVFSEPAGYATIICVIFAVTPSIIIDRPIRVIMFEAFIGIAFCVLTFLFVDYDIFLIDLANLFASVAIGLVIGLHMIRQRTSRCSLMLLYKDETRYDAMTRIYNKEAFAEEVMAFVSAGGTGAFVIVDIDDFKRINDDYSHQMGDATIQMIARSLSSSVRKSDYVGRFGGDEFVMFLPNEKRAKTVETILRRSAEIFTQGAEELGLGKRTMSFGYTVAEPGEKYDDIFGRADDALYQAKKNGKDQIVRAGN